MLIHRVARDTTKEWFQIEDREIQRKHHQMTVVESQPHDDLSSIQGITQSPNWPHDLWGLKANDGNLNQYLNFQSKHDSTQQKCDSQQDEHIPISYRAVGDIWVKKEAM